MKNLLGVFFLFITIGASAQTYSIINSTVMQDDQSRTSLEAELETEPKDTRKAFSKYLKKEHDAKLKKDGDFYAAKESKIKAISEDQIDFYASFKENKNGGTDMSIFARKGYDIYITPKDQSAEFNGMKKLFENFLNGYLGEYYEDKLDDAVGISGDLKKDQEKLMDDNKDLKDDIEDNKKDINKMTESNKEKAKTIEDNNKKLEELNQKISNADGNVDQLKTKKQGINK